MSHIGQIVERLGTTVGGDAADGGDGDDGGVGGALLTFVFFKQDFITFAKDVFDVVVVVLNFFLTVFLVECKFSLLLKKLVSVNFTLVFMSFMV